VDGSGNGGFVGGLTAPANSPTTQAAAFADRPSVMRSTVRGQLKVSSMGLLYSTYLGGNGQDRGLGIAVDAFGQRLPNG